MIIIKRLVGQGLLIIETSRSYSGTHTNIFSRTSLEETFNRPRKLYLTTLHSREMGGHALGGIRTYISSKRAVADARIAHAADRRGV